MNEAIEAALAVERRFGTVEGQLVGIQATLNELVSRVGTQNGRVSKLEDRQDAFRIDPEEWREWKNGVDAFMEGVRDREAKRQAFRDGQEAITKRQWVIGGVVLTVAMGVMQALPKLIEVMTR